MNIPTPLNISIFHSPNKQQSISARLQEGQKQNQIKPTNFSTLTKNQRLSIERLELKINSNKNFYGIIN